MVMKTLSIKNFGPIRMVALNLKKINVVIGPQSSGKSTILKISSFCSWIEKKIQLSQNPEEWLNTKVVKEQLIAFHKLQGYACPGSEISYKSDSLGFAILFVSTESVQVRFSWDPQKRWKYLRTKITYIPAERNVVASIPNWFDINFGKFNNIRNYMAEWDRARRFFIEKRKLNVLGQGVSYYFDEISKRDMIALNGEHLDFSNSSSGLQSLVPQYALLSYLFDYAYLYESESFSKLQQNENIGGIIQSEPSIEDKSSVMDNYLMDCGVSVFLEEPEQNLFPKAQYSLVKWIVKKLDRSPCSTLFLSTHSPYILSSMNNLIQAFDSASHSRESMLSVKKIVGQEHFIDFRNISVYGIKNGRVKSLLDHENRLISQTALDSVSVDISSEFGRLLNV